MNQKSRQPLEIHWRISDKPWSESHGFDLHSGVHGLVSLYLGVQAAIGARNVLVIGSGAGFIPTLFADNTDSEVFLIDAHLPDSGSGSPMDVPSNDFYSGRLEGHLGLRDGIMSFYGLSKDFLMFCADKRLVFDIIFIDGDHSTDGFTSDLQLALRCISSTGVMICHDANQPNIRQILSESGLQYSLFETGTGCAIITNAAQLEATSPGSAHFTFSLAKNFSSDICNVLLNLDASRWDYLASDVFSERLETYRSVIDRRANILNLPIRTVLEIGGNPSPLIEKFHKPGLTSTVAVEPYVSSVAQDRYRSLSDTGLKVVSRISEIPIDTPVDLLLLIGFDLSLSSSFSELVASFTQLVHIASTAGLVVVEHPRYEPSRRLSDLLLANLSTLDDVEIEFGEDMTVSIDRLFTTRRLRLSKSSDSSIRELTPECLAELKWYAKHHDIPVPSSSNDTVLPIQGGARETFLAFNSYPIERLPSGGEEFVWLRPEQTLEFPKWRTALKFKLAWQSSEVKVEVNGVKVHSFGTTLKITRPFWRRNFNVELPFFVPKQIDSSSSDNRRLAFPVTQYSFRLQRLTDAGKVKKLLARSYLYLERLTA